VGDRKPQQQSHYDKVTLEEKVTLKQSVAVGKPVKHIISLHSGISFSISAFQGLLTD
jgi:hypothetical protein